MSLRKSVMKLLFITIVGSEFVRSKMGLEALSVTMFMEGSLLMKS